MRMVSAGDCRIVSQIRAQKVNDNDDSKLKLVHTRRFLYFAIYLLVSVSNCLTDLDKFATSEVIGHKLD